MTASFTALTTRLRTWALVAGLTVSWVVDTETHAREANRGDPI